MNRRRFVVRTAMRPHPRRGDARRLVALAALVLGATCAGLVFAQAAGGEFAVPREVIAGGSASAAGGEFRSAGTLGQHDAGTAVGGDYRLRGGFWPKGTPAPYIFSDGFETD